MKIKSFIPLVTLAFLVFAAFSRAVADQQIAEIKAFTGGPGDGAYPLGPLTVCGGGLYGTSRSGGANGEGTIYEVLPGGSSAVLYNFGTGLGDGEAPSSALLNVSNVLYGTTDAGGTNGGGTIFQINPDGTGYTVLYHFGTYSYAGATNPHPAAISHPGISSLTLVSNVLYGVSYGDGTNTLGSVFQINLDGTGFAVLHHFDSTGGVGPSGALLCSSNVLYGTTQSGGTNGYGTVYQINVDGTGYSVLHRFIGNTNVTGSALTPSLAYISDGAWPEAGLTLVSNQLFGTTYGGGVSNNGVVFRLNTDGSGYAVLHRFSGSASVGSYDGSGPAAPLTLCGNVLCGTTSAGGTDPAGTVFKISPNGAQYIADSLDYYNQGNSPVAGLTAKDGILYGTAAGGGTNNYGTVFEFVLPITGYTVLHHFMNYTNDGANPLCTLTLVGGNLYGTTESGFQSGASSPGLDGILFSINTNGTGYEILHYFSSGDGQGPMYGALASSGDTLYGACQTGGGVDGAEGTVFSVNQNGNDYSVLLTFSPASIADGLSPFATPILISNVLYGTTLRGGTNGVDNGGYGSIYSIHTDGTCETNLHSFDSDNYDGALPEASLVTDGSVLYGITAQGGAYGDGGGNGPGMIFRMNLDGSCYTNLHSFGVSDALDGALPIASLTLAGNVLYGTTCFGGPNLGGLSDGTLFRINTDGTGFSVLHDFGGDDGGNPSGAMVQVGSILYGTTQGDYYGTPNSGGTLFQINTNGTGLVVLHYFSSFLADGSPDGGRPAGGLTLVGNTLYGTTSFGGNYNSGVIFALPLSTVGSTNSSPTYPPLTAGITVSNGVADITLYATGYEGDTFALQSTTNLLTGIWTSIYSGVVGTNGILSTTDSATNSAMFYRFEEE